MGYVDKLDNHSTTARLHEVEESIMYPNVDVYPTVVQYKFMGNG